MTKDEKNAKLAEWLGWKRIKYPITTDQGTGICIEWKPPKGQPVGPPDFYTSEEANALLLDKMLYACESTHIGAFEKKNRFNLGNAFKNLAELINDIRPTYYTLDQMDRKTAICEAALALIEKEAQ